MEVLDKVVRELKDCMVEACVSSESYDSVSFEDNKFKGADTGNRIKLEVRVTKGSKSAYSWTNDLGNWKECLARARKLMLASSPLKLTPALSKSGVIVKSFIDSSINDVDLKYLKEKGLELISSVNELKVNVSQATVNKSIVSDVFLNSEGTSYERKGSSFYSELECAKGSCSSSDLITSQGAHIDFAKLGRNTARLCIDSLKPKQASPGLFDVVFDFNAINQLLTILEPSINASNVLEHNSFLEGKIGRDIASPELTIRDSGIIPDGINNNVMDSEGTLVKDKDLLSKGVLKCFVNDLYSASRLKTEPTGNSAGLLKRGYSSVNNIVINPGKASSDELLTDCIYVNNLMGTHTANTVSGDFALSALNAFKYDSKGKTPLRDVMISSNIFKLLKKISLIGKDVRVCGSVSSPLIKFSNVQVVG